MKLLKVRTIFFIAISVCSITLSCSAAELELKQSQEGPSFEETVNFLKEYIFIYYKCGIMHLSELPAKRVHSKILDISNDCILKTEHTTHTDNHYTLKTPIIDVKITDIKRVTSIEIEPFTGECFRGENTMIHMTGGISLPYDAPVASKKVTQVVKALNHLRKLCGAKDAPF
ncbi:MAG: hypothetical protein WCP20_16310 [Desulfuromonadales bacterium]